MLRIDRVLRPHPDYPGSGAVVYIDYPAADFTIDQTRYCSQSVRRDAFSPAIDDGVLLFAYHPPTDTTHRYLPTSDEYVIFGRGHTLSLPPSIAADAAIAKAESVNALAERVEASAGDRRRR
jgi:hypothetical protein